MAPRLLIVEDDSVQQGVMRSALQKRGYEIEVAADGLTAVRMLRAGGFDLALIDYQLPEIDGYTSARLLRDMMTDADRPKMIAVTASSESLGGREMVESVFDAVLAKPLDLSAMFAMVSAQLVGTQSAQTTRAADETWRDLGLEGAPAVIVMPTPTPAQAQLLRCYFDLSGRTAPQAVLLLTPDAAQEAVSARTHHASFVLPFIDLTGTHAAADAAFSAADRESWRNTAEMIIRFAARRRSLSTATLQAPGLDTRLLTYLFLTGTALQPVLDSASRDCVRYPGFFPEGEVLLAAERLTARGLLERRFFDRFHSCGACASSRLNVREECPGCRSAHLREVALVHHFRCAHQAPEADFIQGPHLVCPKCRQQLRHYGSDYDKPGVATSCGGCGRSSPLPAVGFVCLDCSAHTDGDVATKRDMCSYALTAHASAMLRRGVARQAAVAELGNVAVPDAIARELESGRPVAALFELRYGAREAILARRGAPAFAAMRRLFVENLRNALDADCLLESGVDREHLLVRSAPDDVLAGLGPDLLDACQEVLAEGLEPELVLVLLPPASAPLAPISAAIVH
jgi:CheY-like chemotaxis protein